MRRLVLSVIVASGLVMAGASSASAESARTVAAAKAAAAKKVCKIQSSRLTELSGLVATDKGFITINDGSLAPSSKQIYYLDDDCTIVDQVSYSGGGPRDTEDMALSADGKTLWIADIGDNDGVRETVGLWKMPASGSKRPVLNRLTYPDGAHDAEAMLLNGDGTPIIVTKDVGKAGVYVPAGPLEANTSEGVRMRRVGQVDLPATTTSNPLSAPGRLVITGGAVAPDGSRVVLRTYADAFEFDVTGGDVVAALKGTPRATPLPDEPQGEAITYSADGKTFLTTSDMQGRSDADPNYILRYTPTAAEAAVSVKSTTTAAKPAGDGQSWLSSLSLDDITYLVGGVGLLGAVLVGLGIFGIMRSRRRPPSSATARKGGPSGPRPTDSDAATALMAPVREGPGPAGGGRTGGGGPGRGGRPAGGDRSGGPGRSGSGGPGRGGRPGAGGRQGRNPSGNGAQGSGGGPQRSGAPGGGAPGGVGRPSGSGQGRRPGVYGDSAPPVPQKGSGVYGGAPATGRPDPGGVYAAPPAGPPPAGPPPARPSGPPPARPAGPPPGRTSGFFGANPAEDGRSQPGASRPGPASHGLFQPGAGHPGSRQQGAGMNTYADVNGSGRGDERFGNPGGYGRAPRGR
ncbi:MAG TPA: hypothetical protein VF657_07660 [Actinoplanes sp.]